MAGLLDLDPAPTIVAANASHHSHVTVQGSVGVGLRLRERVQIGRTGSRRDSGAANSTPTSAPPLLRHRIELGAGAVTDDELGRPLALISELRYPATDSSEQLPTGAVLLSLAGDATLLTWQGQRLPPG